MKVTKLRSGILGDVVRERQHPLSPRAPVGVPEPVLRAEDRAWVDLVAQRLTSSKAPLPAPAPDPPRERRQPPPAGASLEIRDVVATSAARSGIELSTSERVTMVPPVRYQASAPRPDIDQVSRAEAQRHRDELIDRERDLREIRAALGYEEDVRACAFHDGPCPTASRRRTRLGRMLRSPVVVAVSWLFGMGSVFGAMVLLARYGFIPAVYLTLFAASVSGLRFAIDITSSRKRRRTVIAELAAIRPHSCLLVALMYAVYGFLARDGNHVDVPFFATSAISVLAAVVSAVWRHGRQRRSAEVRTRAAGMRARLLADARRGVGYRVGASREEVRDDTDEIEEPEVAPVARSRGVHLGR